MSRLLLAAVQWRGAGLASQRVDRFMLMVKFPCSAGSNFTADCPGHRSRFGWNPEKVGNRG